MGFLEINFSGEPGMAIIAIVAFGGGLARGFTGFGGPAFMLAILTLFFTVLGFALISALSGTTGVDDVIAAAPGAVAFLLGTWIGSHGFLQSSEKIFRRAAIAVLLALAVVNLVS